MNSLTLVTDFGTIVWPTLALEVQGCFLKGMAALRGLSEMLEGSKFKACMW